MKFKTPYNAIPSKGEVNTEASKTVPDQSMSVREILERHARGLSSTGTKVPVYHGEENDLPDLARLDLAERQELFEVAAADTKRIRAELTRQKRQQKAAEKAARKAAQNSSNKDDSAAPPSGAQAPPQE